MTPQANAKPPSSRSSRPALLAAYKRWCDECARVTDAYREWADSNAPEEADAWLAYELAVDHAEAAYTLYVQLTERGRLRPSTGQRGERREQSMALAPHRALDDRHITRSPGAVRLRRTPLSGAI
jgi:hypothetical protein